MCHWVVAPLVQKRNASQEHVGGWAEGRPWATCTALLTSLGTEGQVCGDMPLACADGDEGLPWAEFVMGLICISSVLHTEKTPPNNCRIAQSLTPGSTVEPSTPVLQTLTIPPP